jgi:glycosyltransferase involved in cell wall biosynthesis
MSRPSVAVVIPAFNAAEVLSDAIDSALRQDPPAEQVVVVDDGSTDGTEAILRRYRGVLESLRQPNRGPSAARNAGWQRAATDAIAFLDADDLLLPGALEARRGLLGGGDAGWAHTDGWLQDTEGRRQRFSAAYPADGKRRAGRVLPALLSRNFISTSGTIVRRDALEQVGGFDEALRFMEDWDLWLRLAIRFPAAYDPRCTFVQRRRPDSLSRNRHAMLRSRSPILMKIHRLSGRGVEQAGWSARRSVADAYNAAGYAWAQQERWPEARPCLRESVRLWPLQGRAWLLLIRGLLARHRPAARGRERGAGR